MSNAKKTVMALLTSYSYNREDNYMLQLCEEIKKRIGKYRVMHTDDGDNIFGFLVCLYGDYGTSPRSGWISQPQIAKELISGITEFSLRCEASMEVEHDT